MKELKKRKFICIAFAMLFALSLILGVVFIPKNKLSASAERLQNDTVTYGNDYLTWNLNLIKGIRVVEYSYDFSKPYKININYPLYNANNTPYLYIILLDGKVAGTPTINNENMVKYSFNGKGGFYKAISSAELEIIPNLTGNVKLILWMNAGERISTTELREQSLFFYDLYNQGYENGTDNVNKGLLQYVDKMVCSKNAIAPTEFNAYTDIPLNFSYGTLMFDGAKEVITPTNGKVNRFWVGLNFENPIYITGLNTSNGFVFDKYFSFIYPFGGKVPIVRISLFDTTRESLVEIEAEIKPNDYGVQLIVPTQYKLNPYNETLNGFHFNVMVIDIQEPAPNVGLDLDFQYGIASNNNGYNYGYQQGYENGLDKGYNDGFTDGNKNGYDEGYNVGLNKGKEEASNYSFLSLMTAVVDAPVKSFTGLLDFNILGFNMANLMIALLSVALLLKIIQVFTKGG